MDTIVKIVASLGTVGVVVGLFSTWNGWMAFMTGRKNDNGQKVDQGIEGMVLGAVMVTMSGGIAAGIIAAINALPR